MRLLIAVLLTLGLQAPQASVIEGIVTRGNSAQPVGGARVAIWGEMGPDFETRTDANGHYTFRDIPSGAYNMEVQAEGYISVPNPSSDQKVRLTVDPLERLRHDVAMAVVATISGQLLNANQEPVPGLDVEILQLRYNARGRPVWQVVAAGTTNDKGEYRVEGLPPDEYYVRASEKRSKNPANLAGTYFPGTADPRSAAAIPVRDGGETNASFSLARENTYSIEGKITQPDRDSPLTPTILVYAIPQDSRIPVDPLDRPGTPVEGSAEGGWTFKLQGLLPGAYDLFAVAVPSQVIRTAGIDLTTGQVSDTSNITGVSIPGRVATTTVEVRESNVGDVHVSLDPGVDVTGRIRVLDDNGRTLTFEASPAGLAPLELTSEAKSMQVFLSLNRRDDSIAGLVNVRPTIKDRGDSFTFSSVPAGTYDIGLRQLGPSSDFYLADVRESARSVFDEGLTVRNTPVDFVEVIVGFDGGVVEGTVTGNRGTPVFVVLVPHPSRRQNGALFKTAELKDFSVPFRFTGVAPGLYSIFAFEAAPSSESIPYRNTDFLSRYETQGTPVTVERGATVGPVHVPLIAR